MKHVSALFGQNAVFKVTTGDVYTDIFQHIRLLLLKILHDLKFT